MRTSAGGSASQNAGAFAARIGARIHRNGVRSVKGTVPKGPVRSAATNPPSEANGSLPGPDAAARTPAPKVTTSIPRALPATAKAAIFVAQREAGGSSFQRAFVKARD